MYGTVARLRVKPGREAELLAVAREEERLHIPGFMGEFVYHLDQGANEYMLVVLFADKESYFANADTEEQDARYHRMLEILDGEPEWHDGEIVQTWVSEEARLTQPA
jgi:antibiotic biosynthesis monooxygenase (ABM) superfamily enzyme